MDNIQKATHSSKRLVSDAMIYRICEESSPINFETEIARLSTGRECPNCGSPTEDLYCSEFCGDVAKLVRYARKAVDGDVTDEKLIGIAGKLPHIYSGGGYPTKARLLSPPLREAIFQRDNFTCVLCGKPASEIDHICGSSDAPSNLQAVCGPCNMNKRELSKVKRGDPEWERIQAIHVDLAMRIGAMHPIRACDDERWGSVWRKVKSARKQTR